MTAERRIMSGVVALWELGRQGIAPGEPQPGVRAMKTTTFILGTCALLALPIESAGAGQCTSEIDNMAKVLTAQDAGSGPTAGTTGSGVGQQPPTAAMSQADQG